MNPIKLEKDPEGGYLVTQGNLDSGCLSPDEVLGVIAHALYGDGSAHRFLKPQETKPNLLPCPHCGNDSALVTEEAPDCDFFRVVCDASRGKGCGSSSGYKPTEREAIELWNTREVKSNAITEPSVYVHLTDVPAPAPETVQAPPDWSEAPEWAQWWAVDQNGESFWYEEKPFLNAMHWSSDDLTSKCSQHGYEKDSSGWTVSLRNRPTETQGTENEGSDHD